MAEKIKNFHCGWCGSGKGLLIPRSRGKEGSVWDEDAKYWLCCDCGNDVVVATFADGTFTDGADLYSITPKE